MKSPEKSKVFKFPAWLLVISLIFALATLAGAATLTVTNLDDSGAGSLRAAIGASNELPDSDVIEFGAVASSGTIHLQSPLPTIRGEVKMVGPGADQLTVSGDSDDDGSPDVGILAAVGSAAAATISGLTFSDGLGLTRGGDDGDHSRRLRRGGALSVAFGATVTLEKVAIVDCVARRRTHGDDEHETETVTGTLGDGSDHAGEIGFPAGAGIAVLLADLHVDSCLIANNGIGSETGADDDEEHGGVGAGAAIFLVGSPLNEVTIRNSTISGNDANSHSNGNAHSGAIYVAQLSGHDDDDGDTEFEFHGELDFGDDGDGGDGGRDHRFTVVMTNNTVADNTTDRGCAGLVVKNHRPLVMLKNNIFARNTVEDDEETCSYRQRGGHPHPASVSLGGNIFDDASGNHFLTADNDLTENAALELAPLSQNGGPTATHAIGASSSAIGNAVAGAPPLDQRCLARTDPADSGAYEFGAGGEPVNTPPLVVAPIGDVEVDFGAGDLSFSVHPNFSDAEDADADLSYEVTANSDSGVVTTSAIASSDGILTLSFLGSGSSEIEITATDTGGLSVSTGFTVTVGDTEKPVIAGIPDNISVPTDSGLATAVVSWTEPTASDNVGVVSFESTHSPGDTFPLGTTTVSYTATDAAGNECVATFTVTVGDTEKPVIAGIPDNISVPTDPGVESAVVSWTAPTASDNVGLASFESTHNPGDTFPLGTTTVSYTATDAAGNECVATFTVTVGDTEKPVIAGIPDNISVPTDPGVESAVVSWTAPTASDNVGLASFESTHNPGDTFPLGTTTVSYTATDAAGNECVATFTVTVGDTEKPVIAGLPDDIVVQAERGATTAVVEWVEPTASDNVGVVSFTSNFPSGSEFPIGETVVFYTATDAADNSCIATFLVTVEEPESGFFLDFISVRTDPAPGTTGATFNTYQHAFLNENDLVVFEGAVVGGDSGITNNSGIWVGDINFVDVVARQGDAGVGVDPGLEYGLFTYPNISDLDEVSFNNLMTGPVTTISDVGHFAEPGASSLENKAREGDAAPGTGGNFKILHQPVVGSGVTAVPAHLNLVSPISAVIDTGIWSTHTGPLEQVAWEGSPVAAVPGATYGQMSGAINMNDAGELAFQTFLRGAGGANNAVISGLPESLSVAFRKTTVAPGTGGGKFLHFLSTAISGTGHVAVRSSLFSSSALGIGASNNDGIWANIGGTISLVAREGDQVPDLPAGVTFQRFEEVLIADDGSVCFSAFVGGTGVSSANDGGLWSNASGSLKTLLREGDAAADTGGAVIKSILRFSCNNNATVGLVAELVPNIGDTVPENTQGLWLSNPETAELELALRTGSSFEFAPGDRRAINLIRMDKSTSVTGGGGGQGRVLNDRDHVAVILGYSLGSGVFITGRITP